MHRHFWWLKQGGHQDFEKILATSKGSDLQNSITSYPNITYCRGENLRDRRVHSHFENNVSTKNWLQSNIIGSYSCGRCTFCKYMPNLKELENHTDHKKFVIRQFIYCQSAGVIYVIKCTCPKLYVGKTIQQFIWGLSKHISSINSENHTPLSRLMR